MQMQKCSKNKLFCSSAAHQWTSWTLKCIKCKFKAHSILWIYTETMTFKSNAYFIQASIIRHDNGTVFVIINKQININKKILIKNTKRHVVEDILFSHHEWDKDVFARCFSIICRKIQKEKSRTIRCAYFYCAALKPCTLIYSSFFTSCYFWCHFQG